jgi:ASC-1-like (ASCH) protein
MGIKTVEGRLNKGDFADMNIGDCICFVNNDFGFQRTFQKEIKHISYYDSFQSYLETETLEKCLPAPGIHTIEDGLNVYYRYYTQADEQAYKIKAFCF